MDNSDFHYIFTLHFEEVVQKKNTRKGITTYDDILLGLCKYYHLRKKNKGLTKIKDERYKGCQNYSKTECICIEDININLN